MEWKDSQKRGGVTYRHIDIETKRWRDREYLARGNSLSQTYRHIKIKRGREREIQRKIEI